MVPKWKRHWLKTAPALVPLVAVVPPFELVPPFALVPPDDVPPRPAVAPAKTVPLDELPPLPAVPVAVETDVVLEPPAPAEAPAELLLLLAIEEFPPEGTKLDPPPPCPAPPVLPPWDEAVEDVALDPPEELEVPLEPPACLSSPPLAQASSENVAAIRRMFRGVETASDEDRYIAIRLT